MPHYPLTIDFTDASFDDNSINSPVSPDVDVVFPIVEDPITLGSGAFEKTGNMFNDTRATVGTATAQSIALMPNDAVSSVMDEFLFEFDDDVKDDGSNETGLRVTSAGTRTDMDGNQQVKPVEIIGPFEDLTANGTLDVYVPGESAGVFEKLTLGVDQGSDSDGNLNNSGNDSAILVSGDDGANMGDGNDAAFINVDATASMKGVYQGGDGFDTLTLVEGVASDNGALVDMIFGTETGGNTSGAVIPNSTLRSDVAFGFEGFESLTLTNNADTIAIGATVGTGKLTTVYDTAYWNAGTDNSMFKLQTGYTDGLAADVVSINADSNIYMSFEFANDSDVGIDATFNSDSSVDIDDRGGDASSPTIDVDVSYGGGSGMTIDYLEATSNKDVIENNSDIGVMVDLGGSNGSADIFKGSDYIDPLTKSGNDVLDARVTSDLYFEEAGSYIKVTAENNVVNAKLKDVDYIMVRDKVDNPADVDFLKDMSDLIGHGSELISGLGHGMTDAFGAGYDVITSAKVDSFATGSNLRVYYEGDHDDFVDTEDNMTYVDGKFTMSDGDSSRGSTWESEITTQYADGQDPGFYVEVSGKKVAVTFDEEKASWKVDSTSIKVAEDATFEIVSDITDKEIFASDVMDRYGLNPAPHAHVETTEGGGFPTVSVTGTKIPTIKKTKRIVRNELCK
jgi:hypothetical protein